MAAILHQIRIRATPEQVYEALTQPKKLAGWWTRDVKATPRTGSVAEFGFNGRETVFRMRIVELVIGSRVVWECMGGPERWLGTRVTFELLEDDGEMVIRFSHRGWHAPTALFRHCNTKWAYFLLSLKAYLEEGEGTPHPEDVSF